MNKLVLFQEYKTGLRPGNLSDENHIISEEMARKDTKEKMERPLNMTCYYTNQLSAALVTNTRPLWDQKLKI